MAFSLNSFLSHIKNDNAEAAKEYLQTEGADLTDLVIDFNTEMGTAKAITAIGTALQGSNITSLDLSHTDINTPEALAALGVALRNSNITSLNLSGNAINTPEALAALGEALKDTKITSLNLRGNEITTPEAARALGRVLRGSKITDLNLSCNNISTPEAVAALSEALQNSNVTNLNLSGTIPVSPQAIAALRPALENGKITNLDLSSNVIRTKEEVEALGVILQNSNVTNLNLAGNHITNPEALEALGNALEGSKIASLNLRDNWLNTYGMALALQRNPDENRPETHGRGASIANILKQNPQISDLFADDNCFSEEGLYLVQNQLVQNKYHLINTKGTLREMAAFAALFPLARKERISASHPHILDTLHAVADFVSIPPKYIVSKSPEVAEHGAAGTSSSANVAAPSSTWTAGVSGTSCSRDR